MPKQLTPRERLALHMDERRADLDLLWADVAKLASVSTETLRQMRHGEGAIRTTTKRGVERALSWDRGSVNAILAGGDPTPISVNVRDELPSLPAKRDELHALIDQLSDADVDGVHRYLAALVKQG